MSALPHKWRYATWGLTIWDMRVRDAFEIINVPNLISFRFVLSSLQNKHFFRHHFTSGRLLDLGCLLVWSEINKCHIHLCLLQISQYEPLNLLIKAWLHDPIQNGKNAAGVVKMHLLRSYNSFHINGFTSLNHHWFNYWDLSSITCFFQDCLDIPYNCEAISVYNLLGSNFILTFKIISII